MKRIILRKMPVALALCALCIAPALAADSGFTPLFSGKNLDGWVNVNCAPETWSVRDGMIVCTGIPTGVLRTEKMYENFVLELEWRHMHEGGNAGLFVHSDAITAPGVPFTRSIEVQIMDGNAGDIFSIHGATMTPYKPHPQGWMRSLPMKDNMNPAGEWNHYRVESRQGMLTLYVNGELVNRAFHCTPRKGYICLESEGSEIHFRNIRIQTLPGTSPPPAVVAEADEGFKSLYNGLDLRGWKMPEGHKGHWTAQNWILDYDGQSEADNKSLWSENDFGDFELIVDWRLPDEPAIDRVPIILPDGAQATDDEGDPLTVEVHDSGDSGVFIRGHTKCQFNIWNWPVGSGEIWGYRTDTNMPPQVRRAATPILSADNPPQRWNRFHITARGNTVRVQVNGKPVIPEAALPGLPAKGPIGLQHHGDHIQFANIYLKKLD